MSRDQHFPNEVLFKILEKVNSKKDLLSWRLVSKDVTAVATKLFAKRIHSEFVQWKGFCYPEQRATSPIPPDVRLYSNSLESFVIVGKLLPKVNPLISSTLRLVDRGNDGLAVPEEGMINLQLLLSMHGSCLISLSIDKGFRYGTFMSIEEFSKLLAHCPNLMAIRIQGGRRFGGDLPQEKDVPQVQFPHLSKLTHVECDEACGLFRWLLTNLSHQLTHVESRNRAILPLTTENYPPNEGVDEAPFQKLKTLKLYQAGNIFFVYSGISIPIQLQKLSILFPSEFFFVKDICNFVSQFRDSLTELTLPHMGMPFQEEETEIHEHSSFPNLIKFTFHEYECLTTGYQYSDVERAKQHFLPFFPNLVQLDVIVDLGPGINLTFEDARAYVERNEIWNLCPLVKNIRFLEDIHGELPVTKFLHSFVRES